MKQLGNLAVVCARRPDVLMQLYQGRVSLYVGEGPERAVCTARWEDDAAISGMIYALNFGCLSAGKKVNRAA